MIFYRTLMILPKKMNFTFSPTVSLPLPNTP